MTKITSEKKDFFMAGFFFFLLVIVLLVYYRVYILHAYGIITPDDGEKHIYAVPLFD